MPLLCFLVVRTGEQHTRAETRLESSASGGRVGNQERRELSCGQVSSAKRDKPNRQKDSYSLDRGQEPGEGRGSFCVLLSGRSLQAGETSKQQHETHMTSLSPGTCAQSCMFNRMLHDRRCTLHVLIQVSLPLLPSSDFCVCSCGKPNKGSSGSGCALRLPRASSYLNQGSLAPN